MKAKTLSLLIILLSGTLSAQNPGWKHYNTSNSSIPWNKIFCIAIDKQGNFWGGNDNSGSWNHTVRFDGNTWTGYLTSGWVNDLAVDPVTGYVWTSHNDKLEKWDGNTWTSYPSSLLSSWSDPMTITNNSVVWLKSGSSLVKFDGTNFTSYTSSQGLPSENISSLAAFNNELAIGTSDSGLVIYDGSAWNVFKTSNSSIPNNNVKAVKKGTGDTLWIVCEQGNLAAMKGTAFTLYSDNLINANIMDMALDSKGNLWFATSTKRLVKFDRQQWTYYDHTNSPMGTETILSMGIDDFDNIWIGTWNGGLYKFNESGFQGEEYRPAKSFDLKISPNPVEDYATVTISGTDVNIAWKIINTVGQVMLDGEFGLMKNEISTETIDVSLLPAGLYFMSFNASKFTKTQGFIKL